MKIKFYVFCIFVMLLTKTNAQNTLLGSKSPSNLIVLLDTLTYSISENSFTNNLVLLKIHAQNSGFLTFNIISNLPNESINFSVYKTTEHLDIGNIFNYKPIRYNYSFSDTNAYILTGLNKTSKLTYTDKKSKNKFNSQLWVSEQEIIYLLLERKNLKNLQNYIIKFQITEVTCFKIPIVNEKDKLVTCDVQYFYDSKKWWFWDTEAKMINVCYHPEKELHKLTVIVNDYFPHIIDVKILCKNYIDTLKLKKINTDSMYKLQLIYFDNLNKLDISKSKISLDTYTNFIKKLKTINTMILYDSLNTNNTSQAHELYNYFKNKLPSTAKISIQYTSRNKQNIDNGLYIKFH